MSGLINFILILGFVIIVAASLLFFFLYRKVNKFFRSFGKSTEHNGRHRGGGNTYGNKSGIIDVRTPEQANRKIFKEGEGEYVDFTEIDDK
ncbi:DUF4834 family protein [Prevotella sp. OH937_COT-195]|uniref:DUF4834 family protein n=1 Tax=Prevotella sp. OH937_COT-195 TaxID=2491051 RepID=UPI000F64DB6D|nr:DUF4834 family protein [Prevotella sp. OH937_COT-195]RRD02321.1 DUF4834 family protein [Prevotella sp. OH937_COT-195]